jgi:hypothetical protein
MVFATVSFSLCKMMLNGVDIVRGITAFGSVLENQRGSEIANPRDAMKTDNGYQVIGIMDHSRPLVSPPKVIAFGTIRALTVEELPLLFPLGRAMYEEGKLPGSFVNDIFRASWENLYSAGAGIIFAAFEKGELAGAIGGVTYNDLNDGVLVSGPALLYVYKTYRRRSLAHEEQLITAYERWAVQRGVRRIGMEHRVALNDVPMQTLCAKMGFRHLDCTYIKEAPNEL